LKKQPIHKTDWDYLIVLDACRYDFFKNQYSKHLDGELTKVRSRGSATPEWLKNTFTTRTNYNYITANPYINNSNISISEMSGQINANWKARNHFKKIHEAWLDQWNNELNTVTPEKLADYSLSKIKQDSGKTVIHFIQPHRPYISGQDQGFEWHQKDVLSEEDPEHGPIRSLIEFTRPVWTPLFHLFPGTLKDKIRSIFDVGNAFSEYAKEVGVDQCKSYYRQDLDLALEQVSRLAEELEGEIVVTADHGEAFGEEGEWGHPEKSSNDVLLNVPWLSVNEVEEQ